MSDDDLKARFIPIYDRVGTFRLEPIEDVDFGGVAGGLRTVVANDEDVTVDAFHGTTIVIFVALTVGHSVFLPPASGPSQIVMMKDQTGLASGESARSLAFVPIDGDQLLDSTDIVRGSDTHHGVSSITNDGVGAWGSVLDTSALLSDLIAQLGGTDGAGNIFVPFFDAVDSISGWQCTAPNGDRTTMSVGPTSVRMNAQQHDDGAQAYIDVSLDSGIDIETSDPLIPIRINGASMGGASIVRAFPFAFDTPGLLTGAALYTPTAGDILLDAWIEIDTAWDGTTPLGDLGSFIGSQFGWFSGVTQVDMTVADVQGGASGIGDGLLVGNTLSSVAQISTIQSIAGAVQVDGAGPGLTPISPVAFGFRAAPARFTTDDQIKVCVSQDGTNTGDDPASTQGAAVLYLVTATPVAA